MKAKIYVDDSPYYRSHGKAPRGRGGWGFADINDQSDIDKVRWFRGTYADARRQAIASFKADAANDAVIVVMP